MKPSEALEAYLKVYLTTGLFDRNKLSEAAETFDKAIQDHAWEFVGSPMSQRPLEATIVPLFKE